MKKKTKNVLSQIGLRTSDSPISWLMKTKIERPNLVSLAAGFTDNESLPLSISRRLLNELLEDEAIHYITKITRYIEHILIQRFLKKFRF